MEKYIDSLNNKELISFIENTIENMIIENDNPFINEISLKISNININDHSILITETKTKVERIVFYTEATSNLLNKYIIRENIQDFIFIDLTTRKPIKLDRIQKI